MLRKRKAQRGLGGGVITKAANQLSTPQYSPDSPQKQAPFNRHYSSLLDQALSRVERHTALARFHYRQASQHREMKAYLESYIFGGES